MNSTLHTEDTMQSILENMQAVIARQESVHSDLEETTKLAGFLADIQTVRSSNYTLVRSYINTHAFFTIGNHYPLLDPDTELRGLSNEITCVMFPYLSVNLPDINDHDDEYDEDPVQCQVTFKNVRETLREVLADFGIELIKNTETNTSEARNDELNEVLDELCELSFNIY